MLYTGNVNRIIWYGIIPFLVIIYIIFVYCTEIIGNPRITKIELTSHKTNINNLNNIEGFIIGGSNASLSISAEIISHETNQQWYNLTLTAEGESDQDYWNFVKSTTSEDIRLNIKSIIYSSATPLNEKLISKRKKDIFYIIKSPKKLFTPSRSILSYAKEYILGRKNLPINGLGDHDFETLNCKTNLLNITVNDEETNQKQLKEWALSQLSFISTLFPNADILFVKPSANYSNVDTERSQENSKGIKKGIVSFLKTRNRNVKLIQQPSYPSNDMLCNDGKHANSKGRIWRTKNLLKKSKL